MSASDALILPSIPVPSVPPPSSPLSPPHLLTHPPPLSPSLSSPSTLASSSFQLKDNILTISFTEDIDQHINSKVLRTYLRQQRFERVEFINETHIITDKICAEFLRVAEIFQNPEEEMAIWDVTETPELTIIWLPLYLEDAMEALSETFSRLAKLTVVGGAGDKKWSIKYDTPIFRFAEFVDHLKISETNRSFVSAMSRFVYNADETLILTHNKLTTQDMKYTPITRNLDLSHNQLDNEVVKDLILTCRSDENSPSYETINLSHNNLTQDCVSFVADLFAFFDNLRVVDISHQRAMDMSEWDFSPIIRVIKERCAGVIIY